MNPVCWSSCLWLWFICTGVECLPEFHLSSRYEHDDTVTLTISYIVDDTLIDDDKRYIEAWLSWVTQRTMFDFQQFSQFTLNLSYAITYLENEKDLKLKLQPYERESYISPEAAISVLTNYFKGHNQFDIICLVTKLNLDDGFMVRNGYGYHGTQTLCEETLPNIASLRSKPSGILILHAAQSYPGQHKPRYRQKCASRTIRRF
uniref:Putative secreted protein n=1 Tax=Ixodes ricinus TaxID=34613 RepID=V5HBE0_IXORI